GCQPLHELDLGTDRDRRARRRLVDRSDDEVGRADQVGQLDDLMRAFGVHDHDAAVVRGTELIDVRRLEALMDRAVAPPEEESSFLDVAVLEPAEVATWIPHPHLVGPVAELERRVPAEVLIWEEE